MENEKINVRQLTVLAVMYTIGDAILIIPSTLVNEAKQDAWIAAIISAGMGLLYNLFFIAMGRRFENLTIIEYTEKILGRIFGKVITVLFISYFFLLASAVLREVGDFVTTQLMPETPLEMILVLFLLITVMGVRLGLETMGRCAEIFFPYIMLMFIFLAISLTANIHAENILPIFEGIKPILRAVYTFNAIPFMENVVFLMLIPHLNRPKEAGKALVIGTLLGSAVLIMTTLLTILVLGIELTAMESYPSYALAKKINIGNFLQRLEAIMTAIWFLTIFIKLLLCMYASVLGLAQMLKLKNYRPLVLPSGMILYVLSIIISPNITYFQELTIKNWPLYDLTIAILLPLTLFIVSNYRKKHLGTK